MKNKLERRAYDVCELRADNDSRKIVGHAAVFETVASGGWFNEKIARNAFSDSIGQDDIRALINHNPDLVLGRNTSGTLSLREDDKGLWIEINPPDTQAAPDLMTSIERGDISQMSFGFETLVDEWERSDNGDPDLRTLKKVKLWDVSPVTFPFYEQTDVALRSHEKWQGSKKNLCMPRMQRRLILNKRIYT